MDVLAQTARRIGPNTFFTRSRGDGWQMLLDDPGLCLWAAVFMAATLKTAETGLASRIAVGLGTVQVAGPNLAAAWGSAFVASGRALDTMPKGQTLALEGEGTDSFQRRVFAFVDDRMARWSREQAEAMALGIMREENLTQAELARVLGITRQAIAARRQAAGHELIVGAFDDFYQHFHREPPHG
ncbi:hypothetical protein MASR2M74_28040 [Paracoccaceae bacterium]